MTARHHHHPGIHDLSALRHDAPAKVLGLRWQVVLDLVEQSFRFTPTSLATAVAVASDGDVEETEAFFARLSRAVRKRVVPNNIIRAFLAADGPWSIDTAVVDWALAETGPDRRLWVVEAAGWGVPVERWVDLFATVQACAAPYGARHPDVTVTATADAIVEHPDRMTKILHRHSQPLARTKAMTVLGGWATSLGVGGDADAATVTAAALSTVTAALSGPRPLDATVAIGDLAKSTIDPTFGPALLDDLVGTYAGRPVSALAEMLRELWDLLDASARACGYVPAEPT